MGFTGLCTFNVLATPHLLTVHRRWPFAGTLGSIPWPGRARPPSHGASRHLLVLPLALLAAPAADQEGTLPPEAPAAGREALLLAPGEEGDHLPSGLPPHCGCRGPGCGVGTSPLQEPLLSCTPGKTQEEPRLWKRKQRETARDLSGPELSA